MISIVVLGTAQDGGLPHLGCRQPRCEQTRKDPTLARRVASLGVIDSEAQKTFLIGATPDVRVQLDALTARVRAPEDRKPVSFGISTRTAESREPETRNPVDGLILTHAHIGHYTGLVQFGVEFEL